MKKQRIAVALCVLAFAGVALAATSPLLISVGITNAVLEISTNQMPKGWFSTSNSLDRTKSTLIATLDLGATSCSSEADGGAISSATQGNFTAITNAHGTTIAYTWDTTQDLASAQNHWYYHHHCDGTVEVHGCQAAIPVTVTATAYDGSGACHTYQDDAGATVCASDTGTASLPAVQDADVYETDCPQTVCDLGACVSDCEAQCNAAYPDPRKGGERAACASACHCTCKAANPACTMGVGECD